MELGVRWCYGGSGVCSSHLAEVVRPMLLDVSVRHLIIKGGCVRVKYIEVSSSLWEDGSDSVSGSHCEQILP